jgi:hypothetical protein
MEMMIAARSGILLRALRVLLKRIVPTRRGGDEGTRLPSLHPPSTRSKKAATVVTRVVKHHQNKDHNTRITHGGLNSPKYLPKYVPT